jgi:hypothetical protein
MVPKSLVYSGSFCFLPLGCVAPLVIRKGGDRKGRLRLAGEYYLHNITKGDAFEFYTTKVIEFFPW